MLPAPLKKGDVIGFAAPSWLATPEGYAPIFEKMESLGYRVKAARNLYASGWGYAASAEERAEDLNQLIADDEVRMIFFSGGEGADDVLPLLDYEGAARHPKIWMSYSDGTSILNTIWSRTGMTTYYGQMPGLMPGISEYNLSQFHAFMEGGLPEEHVGNSQWRCLCPGQAEGLLTGGYLDNFLFISNVGWLKIPEGERVILFLEDHEKFFSIEHESVLLTRLEQSPIMRQVAGIVFGHYSEPINGHLLERLQRLGRKWNIPVAYCDDFGHGANHAILPIGVRCRLDVAGKLTYG